MSIAKKVNSGIQAVVVQRKFKYTHTACLFIVISNSSVCNLCCRWHSTLPVILSDWFFSQHHSSWNCYFKWVSCHWPSAATLDLSTTLLLFVDQTMSRLYLLTLLATLVSSLIKVFLFSTHFIYFEILLTSIFMIYGVFSILWIALLPLLNCYVSHSL